MICAWTVFFTLVTSIGAIRRKTMPAMNGDVVNKRKQALAVIGVRCCFFMFAGG